MYPQHLHPDDYQRLRDEAKRHALQLRQDAIREAHTWVARGFLRTIGQRRVETRRLRLKSLIVLGKERGYLTYAQVNDYLPSEIVDPEQIEEIVSTINDMNIQVATATEEQSSVVGEINRNVEDINQLTMETADIAHQLTASSRSLQQLSGELDKLVGNFRL